jgi:hypothetical protein
VVVRVAARFCLMEIWSETSGVCDWMVKGGICSDVTLEFCFWILQSRFAVEVCSRGGLEGSRGLVLQRHFRSQEKGEMCRRGVVGNST